MLQQWRSRRQAAHSSASLTKVESKEREREGGRPRSARHSREPSEEDKADDAELVELNASLATLCSVFPDVLPEVFRELLVTFSSESRVQLAAESLLRDKSKVVKGRWQVSRRKSSICKTGTSSNRISAVASDQRFRSQQYKAAVKEALYQEFKSLSHSTIKGVLAEHNYSYTDSRPTLVALMSKSWKFSLGSLFGRKKQLPSVDHPLLVTKYDQDGNATSIILLPTTSEELNEELRRTLLDPRESKSINDQLLRDATLAKELNDVEAEEANAMFECQCCYVSYTFEELTACDCEGHYICVHCVGQTMNEALYGQGWAKSVQTAKSSLRCVALANGEDCPGIIPQDLVRKAVALQKDGKQAWRKFEERTAYESLTSSQLEVAKCPHCMYAEAMETPLFEKSRSKTYGARALLAVVFILCIFDLFRLPLIAQLSLYLTIPIVGGICRRFDYFHHVRATIVPIETPADHGKKFSCQNPICSRVSCLRCLAPWQDIHVCHRSTREALRQFVESAITEAIKRTCPKCNLSFVKSSGCNKLVCVCGYNMCYVCREQLVSGSYTHFCPHFRADPEDDCMECQRCDLYRTEEDEVVIARAQRQAIRQWKEKEIAGAELSDAEIMRVLEGEDFGVDNEDGRVVDAKLKKKSKAWSWL